jgi:hypothetical protein
MTASVKQKSVRVQRNAPRVQRFEARYVVEMGDIVFLGCKGDVKFPTGVV